MASFAEGGKPKASSDQEKKSDTDSHPFFRYYAQLTHQQNMLQDAIRTGAYKKAVASNPADFEGKTVLDVGTGSGILAIFAAQAGARKVYAVEASDMADHAAILVAKNGFENVITVIKDKIENLTSLGEELDAEGQKVDLIISEPMGFMLVHERMLESYILAREKFLKPGGRMFPTNGTIFFLPYSDWTLYNEQTAKAHFWSKTAFHGVDLTSLQAEAIKENFAQAVVGCFDKSVVISNTEKPATHVIDFTSNTVEDLKKIVVEFEFEIVTTSMMHGFGCWFDVDFVGTNSTVTLSTGPNKPTTHWYQCRLMMPEPLAVNATQTIHGTIEMTANANYSYDIGLTAQIKGTSIQSKASVRLHDQIYHYLQSNAAAGNDYADHWNGTH